MLIPRSVFPIVAVAARENTRYAFAGVQVKRVEPKAEQKYHQLRACATDGHRLLIADWREDTAPDAPCEPFATVVSAEGWKAAGKLIPKNLDTAELDEPSANGQIEFRSGNGSLRVDSITEGVFPPFEDVIPRPNIITGITTTDRHHAEPGGRDPNPELTATAHAWGADREGTEIDAANDGYAVSININAGLLRGILDALCKAGVDNGNACPEIKLTVPVKSNRPIRLDARAGDVTYTGVLMPVNPTF